MKRRRPVFSALVALLLSIVQCEALSAQGSPEQQAAGLLHRQKLEEKCALWSRSKPRLPRLPRSVLSVHSYLRQPRQAGQERDVHPASNQDEQWEKDYEAFEALQRAKDGEPTLALLAQSQGIDAKVAKVLQQTETLENEEDLKRPTEQQQIRHAKELQANHHLAEMKAKDSEVSLLRLQGEAKQTHMQARAYEIMQGKAENFQRAKAEQQRFMQWQKAHEMTKSTQNLFATQKETVSLITRELHKHRDMFEVVQELQKEQRQQLRQQRSEDDTSSRFEQWQRSPQGMATVEKQKKQQKEHAAMKEHEAEWIADEGRFAMWQQRRSRGL